MGNRLSSLGVSPYSYNNSNELTSKPGVSYTYDANGNTLSKTDSSGTTSYGWDFENRLASVTLPGTGGTATFKYDPFGRRIEKVSSAGTTIYAYDRDNVAEELNASGSPVARYTQGLGIDEPLAMYRSGVASYYHADGLGSVETLTNSQGKVATSYTYDSFGKLTTSTGTITNPFQYTGREFDSETGLYYYRARYYDPSVGRFLSEDPVRFFESPNFYSYVNSSPLNLTDLTGLGAQKPSNLPVGTPQIYWNPFSDAFAEALNRLNSTRCTELFEGSCHEGPETKGADQLRQSEYRFVPLPQGNGTGAQTVDSTHVQINSLGLFMTASGGDIRLPDGSTYDLGSVTNVQAFILLHELGHQLANNTDFTEDVDAATNAAHSIAVIKACFQ